MFVGGNTASKSLMPFPASDLILYDNGFPRPTAAYFDSVAWAAGASHVTEGVGVIAGGLTSACVLG